MLWIFHAHKVHPRHDGFVEKGHHRQFFHVRFSIQLGRSFQVPWDSELSDLASNKGDPEKLPGVGGSTHGEIIKTDGMEMNGVMGKRKDPEK